MEAPEAFPIVSEALPAHLAGALTTRNGIISLRAATIIFARWHDQRSGALPLPAPTYRLDQILARTGLTARTVRYYIQIGLIPGPEPRGVATVYSHNQLVRLLAIVHLRETERLRLPAIRKRLKRMSDEEIAALLPPPPAAPAPPAKAEVPYAFVRWDHVELVPGLEIRVRSDAGPMLRRMAEEIHARYGAGVRGEEPVVGG